MRPIGGEESVCMQSAPVDQGVLGARLRQQTDIDDPITGAAAPMEVEARSLLWPHASLWARVELMQITQSAARRLEEFRFTPAAAIAGLPRIHGPGLPVAMIFERSPNGASRARLYSAHELVAERAPILPVDPHLTPERGPDDILARYFPVLHSAALEATLDLFEEDGYLQHSNGETYQGRERLRIDFTRFFQSGGIRLRYCNRMDDGPRTVFEAYMPSGRPAVAVYERGLTGRIGAVRLYL
jgi:hypothetical protein